MPSTLSLDGGGCQLVGILLTETALSTGGRGPGTVFERRARAADRGAAPGFVVKAKGAATDGCRSRSVAERELEVINLRCLTLTGLHHDHAIMCRLHHRLDVPYPASVSLGVYLVCVDYVPAEFPLLVFFIGISTLSVTVDIVDIKRVDM